MIGKIGKGFFIPFQVILDSSGPGGGGGGFLDYEHTFHFIFIFILLRRVALQPELFYKGPST